MLFKNLKQNLSSAMNGANLITLIGIWLTIYVIVLRFNGQGNMLTASITFLATGSDLLDGYYARKYDCETYLGSALDRIRDKLLAIPHFWFILMSYWNTELLLKYPLFASLVALFLIEVSLLSASIWGITKEKSVSSNCWGKRKMAAECAGMIIWTLFHDLTPFGIHHTHLFPTSFIILCFISSFFLAGMSLREYHARYFQTQAV